MSDQQLHALRETLTSSDEPVTAARIAEAVRASGLALGAGTTGELVRTLRDELVGLGPLQPLVEQPGVTDVLIDGHRQVWTDGASGLARTDVRFSSEEQVRGLARRLIALSGGRLDEGQPCADGRIGDCRIHAVIPPVAVEGTMISVRISRGSAATLEQLALQWDAPEVWLPVLRGIVDARMNCLISGAPEYVEDPTSKFKGSACRRCDARALHDRSPRSARWSPPPCAVSVMGCERVSLHSVRTCLHETLRRCSRSQLFPGRMNL